MSNGPIAWLYQKPGDMPNFYCDRQRFPAEMELAETPLVDARPLLKEIERLETIAHRAAGTIDILLMYATIYPNDSHAIDAMTFLNEMWKEQKRRGRPRMEGQIKTWPTSIPPYPHKKETT